MLEELLKAIPVFLSSMLKFILGPILGFGAGLHFITTVLATIGGMMTSVVLFTYFGEWLRNIVLKRLYRNQKKFSSRSRRIARSRKYGLTVIALLTPVVLTPIGGTLLAVGGTKSKERIILTMLVSATGWSVIFCGVIYFLGSDYFPEFMKWLFMER
jgi:cytochrome c biogenesis protein CcdA